MGQGVLDIYKSLPRIERPSFYKLLDALFGYDIPGPHSTQWSIRASGMLDVVKKRPEIIAWLWRLQHDRRGTASRALDPEAVPLDEATFRGWAEGLLT